MDAIGIKIYSSKAKGITKLLNQLPERMEEAARRMIGEEFEKAGAEARSIAASFAYTGHLAGGIQSQPSGKNWTYASTAPYAAALEFGTKSFVQVPAGYERMASKYKGAVSAAGGGTARDRIYAWARDKGFSTRGRFYLFMRIKNRGMPKRGSTRVVPHFLPPYIRAKSRITRKLKSLLKKALN
jgi:hypothetical protein